MVDTQKNIINAEEIGYMSYNKLNIFITILLLGFSITFAVLGDRVEQDAMWWGIILLLLPLLTLAPTSIKVIHYDYKKNPIMFLPARFIPGYTTLTEFIRDNKIKSIKLLLYIVAFGITLYFLT